MCIFYNVLSLWNKCRNTVRRHILSQISGNMHRKPSVYNAMKMQAH